MVVWRRVPRRRSRDEGSLIVDVDGVCGHLGKGYYQGVEGEGFSNAGLGILTPTT